jgi:DnaJ-domain-containing protein 1
MIEDAREVWFVQGLLFVTRYGSRRHVGCTRCVRNRVIGNIVEVMFIGWWSIWGFLAAPVVLIQNFVALLTGPRESLLRSILSDIGIDAEEVTVDAFGRTKEQRLSADAILDVLVEAAWSDGNASPEEIRLAADIGERLLGDAFTLDEIVARLHEPARAVIPESLLRNPDRVIVLRAALAVLVADGVLAQRELAFLSDLARRLAVPPGVLEQILRGAGVGGPAEPARATTHILQRAGAILGIPPTAKSKEAKAAHRREAMKHHPDRAGSDPADVQRANARMAELNWAYEQFAAQGTL